LKTPQRGEVWLVDLGLAGKIRPALILSVPYQGNERSLFTVVPHTTSLRGSRFEINVSARFLKPGAFDAQGLIPVAPIKLVRLLGKLSTEQMRAVETVVSAWLGFTQAPE
jgi:mRNA interferase MazF